MTATPSSSCMPCLRFAVGFMGILLGFAWPVLSVSAQDSTPLPSEQYSSIRATATIPQESLPSIDGAALRAEAREQADEVGPYRFGKAIETDFSLNRHGSWEQLPTGAWLWRLRIQSRNAVSLNLGIEHFQLPAGAKLYVHGPDSEVVHGPYSGNDATNRQLWTPIVPGSEVVVELIVPEEKRPDVSVHITKVSHGFRPIDPAASEGASSKALACNIDVACPKANPWSDQVRSVGLYSVNGVDVCTGSLINNTNEDGTPYFLTAEHCLEGSEEAATSMVFYWNYQHPTCRPPGSEESGMITSDDKTDQTSSGAILRMSYGNCENTDGRCFIDDISGKSDVTLVEIDEPIPLSYNLFLNGWDRTDFAPSEAVSIHHPQTHGKRITFEYNQTSITGLIDSSNNTHIRVNWDDGTTEQGSSGGPLFDSSHHTVGVLSAGNTGCEIQDWFGRIHNAWIGGGTPGTGLQYWLDPNNTDTQVLDGQPLSSDTVPPARVPNFSVTDVTTDSVTLQWTAPGDDGMVGSADRYLLRYRTSTPQLQEDVAITTREDFERARSIPSVPDPDSAGSLQSVTVPVEEDSSYYFALVALDEVRNSSPIATISHDVTPVAKFQVTDPAPNPARNQTVLRVVTKETQRVRAILYDILGRRIFVLFDDEIPPFRQETISVDVSTLSSGPYFLRFVGENFATTRKFVVVR